MPAQPLHPCRVTRSAPKTLTPLPVSSAAPTAAPSEVALAMCASQGASISILPMTFTLERKQSRPFGLPSLIVLLPITFPAGRTRISAGWLVGESFPEEDDP